MTTYITDAGTLYRWTLTLENGETREVASMSLRTALGAALPAQVIEAKRGAAIDPSAPVPAPVLTALVPASAVLGEPSFTLSVQGTGFRAGDLILWNGAPEPTTFVSDTELTTGVNMDTAINAVPCAVAVQGGMGQVSNELTFEFQAAAPPGRRGAR